MAPGRVALTVALALAMPAAARASAPEPAGDGVVTQERRAWYLPDQTKLQLAGNIGFVSPSVGWSWRDRRLEADLFLGWVPQSVGGIDIYSLTGKLTWLPWRVAAGDEWQLIPLSLALQLTYTFGEDYFVFLPDHYPEDYYELPTALRAGVGLGGGLGRPLWGLDHVGLYYELVAIDALLGFWVGNPDTVGLNDVFSLALGLRVEL